MSKAAGVDLITKVLIVVLVMVFIYLITFLALTSLFVPQQESWQDMMHQMMGFNQQTVTMNLIALSLALGGGVIVSTFLTTKPTGESQRVDELKILSKALSDDEKAVIEEVRRAGEITQDSLRFRLDWSKAKVSRILTNLDKMNLIQRKRTGKTYTVFLAGKQRRNEN